MNPERIIAALVAEYNHTPLVGHIQMETEIRQRTVWGLALRLGLSDSLWAALEADIPNRRHPEAAE
jgi:hypothetical protein